MERLVLARVKWSAQPINPYSLGFRSGVGTIDAIATLIHKAAPITTFRSGYKSRSATIFLDLEKAFEPVSKEVLLESAALLGIQGQLLVWLDDYLTNRTISRNEVQDPPPDKWHTTRQQPEPNIIQHGDQSTTTTGPG